MGASLVITGTEITRGAVQDSHLGNLGRLLGGVGVSVDCAVFVPDSADIESYVRLAARESDIIITTGGLGPTEDDKTRDAVAAVSGRPLVKDEDAYRNVERAVGKERCVGSNLRQTMLPDGFHPIENFRGSAPGFWGIADGKLFVSLPGPPRELSDMTSRLRSIVSSFVKREEEDVYTWTLFAVPEAHFNDVSLRVLSEMGEDGKKLTVGTCFEEYRILVYIYTKSREAAERYVRLVSGELSAETPDVRRFFEGARDVFSMIAEAFSEKGLTLSAAESITGGFLSKCLTDVPGASKWFRSGIVTYSDDAKRSELGVPSGILSEKGAVSRECAEKMAEGSMRKFSSDVAVSLTGFAGPEGDDVGLVWFGIARKNFLTEAFSRKFRSPSRNFVRKNAVVYAALLVLRAIGDM